MDEYLLVVEPGGELPKRNGVTTVSCAVTGDSYKLKVKEIKELRWNARGALVVEVKGTRLRVEG